MMRNNKFLPRSSKFDWNQKKIIECTPKMIFNDTFYDFLSIPDTFGISNSREISGTLTFIIPSNLSSNLFYNCGAHSGMGGSISIE